MPSFTTSMAEANTNGALDSIMNRALRHPAMGLGSAAVLDFGAHKAYHRMRARGSMEGYVTNSNRAHIAMKGSGYDNPAMRNEPMTAPTVMPTAPSYPFPLPSASRGGMMNYSRPSGPTASMVNRDQDLSDLI